MPSRFEIEGRIVAHDETTVVLERVSRNMESFAGRASKSNVTLAGSTREATQSFRAMTVGLLSEVNPALGQAVNQMSLASRQASQMIPIFGGIIVVLAAVSIGLGELISRLNRASARQVELNAAIKSFDVAALSGGLIAATKELEKFDRSITGSILRWMREGSGSTGFWDRILGREDLQKAVQETQEAFLKLFPWELAQRMAAITQKEQEDTIKLAAALRQLALERGDLRRVVELEEQITAATREQTFAILDQTKAKQQAERGAFAAKLAGAPEAERQKAIAALDERHTRERIAELVGITNAEDLRGVRAEQERTQAEIERLETIRSIVKVAGEYRDAQSKAVIFTVADVENLDQLITKHREKLNLMKAALDAAQKEAEWRQRMSTLMELEATTEQARLAQAKVGADAAMAAALTLRQIEAERVAQLKQAALIQDEGLKTEKERAIHAQANLKRAQADLDEALRTNPFMGLQQGLQDVVDEFTSFGTLMRSGVRSMGQEMARHFSDTFVATVTGDFKKLQDLPKQFALNTLRVFGDVLGKLQTGFIVGGLQRMFPGMGAFMWPGVAGGFRAGSALAPALAAGMPLEIGERSFITPGGGGGFGVPLPIGQWNQWAQAGGPLSFLNAPLVNAPWGTGWTIGGSAADMFGMAIPAVTWGQALGITGGAAGLGLTVWSALQGAPTAQNIAMSGVRGALSGAVIGSVVPGIGTVVGAIAGGLIGGGAAAFGKGGRRRRPSAHERSGTEAQEGAAAFDQALSQATTAATLLDVINRGWTPHRQLRVHARGPGGRFIQPAVFVDPGQASPGDEIRQFTADDLRDETLMWEVMVGPVGALFVHAGLTNNLRTAIDRVRQQAEQEARGAFAFEEILMRGDVSAMRRTFLPTSPSGIAQGTGQQLMVSRQLLEQLLGDPDMVERVLRKLVEVARDRDVKFQTPDEFGVSFA